MSEPIDWKKISRDIENNKPPAYNSPTGLVAIEKIIGEDTLRQAVDYYVAWQPEHELAWKVLRTLRPWSAMQRCYEIFHSNASLEERRTAVGLLRETSDERVLDWIDEFLADSDDWIQNGGMSILDSLLFGGGIRYNEPAMEKVNRLLSSAEMHPSVAVRQMATSLVADEARRKAEEEAWADFYRSKQSTMQ